MMGNPWKALTILGYILDSIIIIIILLLLLVVIIIILILLIILILVIHHPRIPKMTEDVSVPDPSI